MAHDVHQLGEFLLHRLERDTLIALNAAHQPPDVLLREKAFGDNDIEIDIEANGDEQQQQHDRPVRQRPAQTALVAAQQGAGKALAEPVKATPCRFWPALEQISAHHRRRGQRKDQGYCDGGGQGNGEFAEQAAQDAAHQQDWDEHRHQRYAD